MDTEFSKEFIDQQKQLAKKISPLPWTACSCGKCGSISNETDAIAKATMGNWGDDYPDIRRIGGSIEGKFETFMNQITYGHIPKSTGNANAKYIEQACNNYLKALEKIEQQDAEIIHQAQRIVELLRRQLQECCEWHEVWEYTDYRNNEGFWYLDTACSWEYPESLDELFSESDTIQEFTGKLKLTYCPSCGKKIRYAKEVR